MLYEIKILEKTFKNLSLCNLDTACLAEDR